jgi:hypothetical protein
MSPPDLFVPSILKPAIHASLRHFDEIEFSRPPKSWTSINMQATDLYLAVAAMTPKRPSRGRFGVQPSVLKGLESPNKSIKALFVAARGVQHCPGPALVDPRRFSIYPRSSSDLGSADAGGWEQRVAYRSYLTWVETVHLTLPILCYA